MLFNESSRIRWTLSYGDESIEQVDYFKYLGVWLDSDLKWEYQIGKLNSKLSQVAGIFKKISPVIKAKLSRNARLTKLKTSLNKIQSGFDKLDRMEKIRLEET
ncbi:hypothetical protein pipiens_008767 [Culex pipiens pipiens]|uniref:Uncharacterized protein n=1 Tax=Culex pipiens pipiens TaxID=38569 RepID=A0ABD1DG95_CULPP